jgi:hypothetical protein
MLRMRLISTVTLLVASLLSLVVICQPLGSEIPGSLRGGINVDQNTINIALEMQQKGWEYIMPSPKSSKASWGNTDGRTTWWVGYWHNNKTNKFSSSTPKLIKGEYVGDDSGGSGWRRGGSPRTPTKLEWLLSKSGGIKP